VGGRAPRIVVPMARTRRCKGTNKAGKRCSARPQRANAYCRAHDPELADEERFGSKEQSSAAGIAGGGRPRKPSPSALLRERIEADIERLLAPYPDALVAVRGEGEPDHNTRMRAAREVFDRVYGKPRKEGEEVTEEEGMTKTTWDLRRLTDEELRTLRELAVKAGAE
jgi:hypothetical protein